MKALTRKQAKQALDTIPLDHVLGIQGELTHKQKTFARLVAQGETGASAYRKSYKSTSKPRVAAVEAHKLKKRPEIANTIEAFRLANEVQEYQTPAQLRALVLHSLVQTVIDPEVKAATRVQAAKILGQVTEVAAFTTRTEHKIIKSSEDAKTTLLAKLREVMNNDATDAQIKSADSLLAELMPQEDGNDAIVSDAPPVSDLLDAQDQTPTAPNADWSPMVTMHTIPHNQSVSNSIPDTQSQSNSIPTPPPINSAQSLEDELKGNTPPSDLK